MRVRSALVVLTVAVFSKAANSKTPPPASLVGSPDPLPGVVIKEAFPSLPTFTRPLYLTHPPDGTDRIFVVEQGGRVFSFENRPAASRPHLALDLSRKVLRANNEEGLLGLAFHPRFKDNGYIFVQHSAADPLRHVVARYTMDDARQTVLPDSDLVLLEIPKPYGNHNGGMVEFGPDGYLYLGFGDGGAREDPHGNGQNKASYLAKILRIDVDRREGNKPYAIPPDNPFVADKTARPEIYAYGIRNPWRFSFDRKTKRLIVGDIGQYAWEEIDIVRKGGNYGWNHWEGTHPFGLRSPESRKHDSTGPFEPPVWEYPRHHGQSVTGGYVYWGKKTPSLRGLYIFGDYQSGAIWSLDIDARAPEARFLGRSSQISSFGEDRDGEVYWTSFDGRIYTFATRPPGAPAPRFPTTLSATRFFPGGRPHPALVPYDVAVPLWSDGGDKNRWVMIPPGASVTVNRETKHLEFPRGTTFVKEFSAQGKKLETRFLVNGDDGWAGYTYVWDAKQKDAKLIRDRINRTVAGRPWTFPSRDDCMTCHTKVSGVVLGFKPKQLGDQLAKFVTAGVVSQNVKVVPPFDPRDARAYLDANCAHCHQPKGSGNSVIDLRWSTPLAKTNLVDQEPTVGNLGITGAKLVAPGHPERSILYRRMGDTTPQGMPPLAHNMPDANGLALVAAWIESLTGNR